MPHPTFDRLPSAKQKILKQAAIKEFATVSYNDASINKIIQDAGISRGSFYQYFDDKEDLYLYLVSEYRSEVFAWLVEKVQEEEGDLLKGFEALYDTLTKSKRNSRQQAFVQNVFLNMRYTTERKLQLKPSREEIEENNQKILSSIDRSHMIDLTTEEIIDVMQMLWMVTSGSLAHVFMNQDQKEAEITSYHRRIRYLRYGLYKKEEEKS